jgi:hypothetical protein
MGDAAEALRCTLEAVRAHIPATELRRLVKRWTVPMKAVARVVEVDASGSLCSTRGGCCLVPGVSLSVGERFNGEVLPVPTGSSWTFWTEKYERMEEGWSLEASSADAKRRQKNPPSSASPVYTNDRSHRERGRRADPRGAQGR